jgi:hypothetical protein
MRKLKRSLCIGTSVTLHAQTEVYPVRRYICHPAYASCNVAYVQEYVLPCLCELKCSICTGISVILHVQAEV